MKLSIDRPADGTQTTGYIDLYNISRAHEGQVYERGEYVSIEAGYPERVGLLFNGPVQRVRRRRASLARVTSIRLGDATHGPATLGGVTSRSYAGPMPVRDLVSAIADDMGIPVADLGRDPGGRDGHGLLVRRGIRARPRRIAG